jgi:hypothetical protein
MAALDQYQGRGCGGTCLVSGRRAWPPMPGIREEGVAPHTLYGYGSVRSHTPCVGTKGCGATRLVWKMRV